MARFLERRKAEWMKFIRRCASCRASIEQRRLIREMDLGAAEELVVFFVPTVYECNGGVMSIASLATVTRKLKPQAKVLTATMPGDPTLVHNDFFPNDETVLTLKVIAASGCRPKKVMLHLPEMSAGDFVPNLTSAERAWLKAIPDLHINILDQNVDLMHSREDWQNLFELTRKVTQTTAHESTGTQATCDKYGIPLHHFSVNIDHSWWPHRSFREKEKLIVFSPDPNEWEPKVRAAIERNLPDYRIEVVNNMTFVQYLDLVSRAMCVISFGEAFDGYFIQPPHTGTLGIAAYIERFFPSPDWKELETVYDSYADMVHRLPDDIRRWEKDETAYNRALSGFLSRKAKLYFDDALEDNVRRFYEGNYDFYPREGVNDGL